MTEQRKDIQDAIGELRQEKRAGVELVDTGSQTASSRRERQRPERSRFQHDMRARSEARAQRERWGRLIGG